MYGLTTIKGRIGRGMAAVALAALIFLPAPPASAQARGKSVPTGTVTFTYIVTNPGLVGLVWGQTMRLNFALRQDGGVRPVRAQVRVSNGGTTILIRNHELDPTSRFHSLDIGRGDLAVAGEPGTGRVQLWVEVELVLSADARLRAEDAAASLFLPTYELINDERGETAVIGLLLPAIQSVK